ncbi:MAG: DUF1571 domain-containing protein [Planctomycetaceae bacterium]|nr:DUF1571 domain-containing protein [Planctomycetaceae bacterium]
MPHNLFTMDFRRMALIGIPFLILFNCSLTSPDGNSKPAVAQGPGPRAQPVTQTNVVPADHPLLPVLKLAKASRERLSDVKDYSCLFNKRDLVNGKICAHTTQVKFRETPMSVYMRFDNPSQGREVIYVEGQNNGNLLAHEPGLLGLVGTVSLKPDSPRALSESRHPITEFGLKNLVNGAIAQWEAEAQFAGSETQTKFYPKAKLGNAECQVIETWHPVPRRQFAFYMTRLYIDNKTQFPVRMEQYGYPSKANEAPPLIEEYTYYQIQINRGFRDLDFDPNNPGYGF